ncbi:MAG: hypothetical protein KDK53_13975 [Maritimibacter sp.]|nr:hypothetical protein [Maritimibacter sp.]
MLTRCRRHYYHDRRRIAFATVVTLAAGFFGRNMLPDPLPVATEILVVAFFLATIPLFTTRFRSKRHLVELTAIGNLIVTFSGDMWPDGMYGWHDVGFLLTLQIPVFFVLIAGLNLLLYRQWSEIYLPRRKFVARTKLRSQLSLHDLWYGMVPTPGYIDYNPDREVVSIEYADASRKNVRLTTWRPPRAGTGEALIAFDRIVPLRFARFTLSVLRGTRDPDGEGETTMRFEDRGTYRVIHIRHRVKSAPLRRAILGYFDDTFGRMMSARLDAIETRIRCGRATKTVEDVTAWFEPQAQLEEVTGDDDRYRTPYGRRRTDDETRVLQALGRI